jgi:hypothetical protein
MGKPQKIVIAIVVIAIVGGGIFFFARHKKTGNKQIDINGPTAQSGPLNTGNVSPITGEACTNWNARPIAVMQPTDVTARPSAGLSQADMVFEMPIFTDGNTRLMGVYGCNVPNQIGSMRSGRHDYIPLAASLDAIYVHWGGSVFALNLLKKNIINDVDCLQYSCSGAGCTGKYCDRWPEVGKLQFEDTGYTTNTQLTQAEKDLNFSTKDTFAGYPHQADAPLDQRPTGGTLHLAYPSPYQVNFTYDKNSNSYLRSWNKTPDIDKNNNQRIAPKNVVVMFAQDSQIKLADEQTYVKEGLMDPWSLVPKADQQGIDYGGVGRYNNLELGDPWFDTIDSGDAYFYMNGKQTKGTWKKDKSQLDSKLTFYDSNGQEIKFVPGQIWVSVMEPGQGMDWTPGT